MIAMPSSFAALDCINADRAEARRCVVVGAGSVGRRHLRNLRAMGVEAIALRTMRGQSGLLDGWNSVSSWTEVAEFGPSMAIIANPTAMHVDAAIEATRLGLDILIEKPVAERLEAAMQLQAAVAKRRTRALVGYQYRFHPTLTIVRDWVREGLIGVPVSAQSHWGEYLPGWHAGEDHTLGYSARSDLGGGVVRTLSHPVDYLRWILGEIKAVSAMTARRSGFTRDVEDVAALTLLTSDGAIATMSLDYVERPGRHSLTVTGTEGTIFWDAGTGIARICSRHPDVSKSVAPPTDFDRNTMFTDELRHFLACAHGDAQPRCTLRDGLRSVAISEAALQSAREGRVMNV